MLKKMVGEDETLNVKSKVDLVPCKVSISTYPKSELPCGPMEAVPYPNRYVSPATSYGWVEGDDGHLEPLWPDDWSCIQVSWTFCPEVMKKKGKRRKMKRME